MNSQAARRYACDRCRDQKLRCPRKQPGNATCDRCHRVGAFCVTSSGRPLGRPPGQANDSTRCHGDSNQHQYHARNRRDSWRPGRSISTTSNPLPSPRSYPSSTVSGSGSSGKSPYDSGQFDVMPNLRLDEDNSRNDASTSTGFSLAISTSQPQFCLDSMSVPELDLGHLGDIEEPQSTSLHGSMGDADENDSGRSDSLRSNMSVNGDSTAILVGVVGSISRQLAELKNQSWGTWDPYQMRLALLDPEFTCSGPVSSNSWESTLGVPMRFVLILQTMVPAQSSTALPLHVSPPLSMTLMLLSTYIQLGELFDTIFTRISNCMQEAPRQPGAFSSAQPAGPHIMMMIQVFEHQLHSVERLLGLPADCRHWSQKDAYAGILDQEESSVLIQAVMKQAQEKFRSLKRTIDRIQMFLGASGLSLQAPTR